MKAVQCTQCFPPFREEILAHGRHMVQFTLGGGRRSPGPASINTFLVNSLIAVRYRKPPRAQRDMTQVCLQLITQRERSFSQKEKKNRHVPRPPCPFLQHVWSLSEGGHPPGRFFSAGVAQVVTFFPNTFLSPSASVGGRAGDGKWGRGRVRARHRGWRW